MIYEMQNEIDDMKRQMEEKDDTMNSIISEKDQEIALLKEKLKNLKVE